MGTVRLKNSDRRNIERKAMRAFDKTNPKTDVNPEFIAELIQAVRNSPEWKLAHKVYEEAQGVWNESESFRKCIPAITDVDTIQLSMVPRNVDEKEIASDLCSYRSNDTLQMHVSLPTQMSVYINPDNAYYNTISYQISDMRPEDQQSLSDKFIEYAKGVSALRNKRQKYDQDINAILYNCNTLKQLLDTQSSLETFVYPDLIEKMHVKETRGQAAQKRREAINFDAAAINQVVLTSKLMGA